MSVFFKSQIPETGIMWDTWLYQHDDVYYLYYLARSGDQWDNISMATSTDGVTWTELGPILRKSTGVTWMGTGSTWESPNRDGGSPRFQMNFSEWRGERQTIFFAESDDLIHWKRRDDLEFVQDERWYEPNGRWDCIWTIPCLDGGLFGYWTATPRFGLGARFGMGRSLDGVTWEALHPPEVHGASEGEVGAIEQIGGRYYMMFGNYPHMLTLIADTPEGPFHVAPRNQSLLSGHTYFSRFFPTSDGLLVNHHSIARDDTVYLGLLKRAAVDADGTLRLGWWEGNDRLKRHKVEIEPVADGNDGIDVEMLREIDSSGGLVIEGYAELPLDCFAPRRGVYIEYGRSQGFAILIDCQMRVEFHLTTQDGAESSVEARADREMTVGTSTRWRVVLEHSLLEFYLDEVLQQCFSMPEAATGRIGLIGGRTPGCFHGLEAWTC